MDIPRFKAFSEKYFELQELKAKQKELQAWLDKEQDALIDQLLEDGVDKFSLAGGTTIYVRTMIWAKIESRDAAIQAIKDSEIKDLIEEGFNSARLSSYIRELINEGKDLPESFKGIISPNPTQSLIARKI